MVTIISVLGMLFSLGGNILIMMKKKSGWLAWVVGNVLWIVYNFITNVNIPMVMMYLVYTFINIMGYCKWCEQEDKKKIDQ